MHHLLLTSQDVDFLSTVHFLKTFIAQKVCTVYSRTIYKIFPLTNLNNYLHDDKSGTSEYNLMDFRPCVMV
jgi:hypothetical protein